MVTAINFSKNSRHYERELPPTTKFGEEPEFLRKSEMFGYSGLNQGLERIVDHWPIVYGIEVFVGDLGEG